MAYLGRILRWPGPKSAALAAGIRAVYACERLGGWRRMVSLRAPARRNALGGPFRARPYSGSGCGGRMTITQGQHQVMANPGAQVEVMGTPAELDLTTADSLAEQGCMAIGRRPLLLLLDLTGLSFCDARGLSAFVRIANKADVAGCRYALIAPQPPVMKMLRIGGLSKRLPTYPNIADAVAHHTP